LPLSINIGTENAVEGAVVDVGRGANGILRAYNLNVGRPADTAGAENRETKRQSSRKGALRKKVGGHGRSG